MVYTSKNVKEFRQEKGTLAEKITSELALIDTELDTLAAVDAGEIKVLHGTLTAGVANAFAFAVQNPSAVAAHVLEVVVDVTTAGGTATSVLNVAVVADATSTGDTILDGVDLDADAVSRSNNVDDSGTNGDEKVKRWDAAAGTNDYITGKILVADAASLVGTYTIYYKNLA
ncbi:MAG: hypothetical protein KAJ03_01785 [Gammaproteobacteria bacterium]|nr:hypothetical protein [Gammaproteobacteria bacterium]